MCRAGRRAAGIWRHAAPGAPAGMGFTDGIGKGARGVTCTRSGRGRGQRHSATGLCGRPRDRRAAAGIIVLTAAVMSETAVVSAAVTAAGIAAVTAAVTAA